MTPDRERQLADIMAFARRSVRAAVRRGGVHPQDAADLLAEAVPALLRAVDRYDARRSAWRGYASAKAKHAVLDACRTGTWTAVARNGKAGACGRVPTFDPTPAAVAADWQIGCRAVAEDEPAGDGPEAEFMAVAGRVLADLGGFERALVIDSCVSGRGIAAVAAEFGLSESRGSQVRTAAVQKLRAKWPRRSAVAEALYG